MFVYRECNIMPSLQTSFVQFTEQENSEIVHKALIELSINGSVKRCQI